MRRRIERFLPVFIAVLLTVLLIPFGMMRTALADDPATDPAPAVDPVDPYAVEDPHPGQQHVYDENMECELCGQHVTWDVAYVDENDRGAIVYVVDYDGNVRKLTDDELAQVGLIVSMYRLDQPDYRYDFGLSAVNSSAASLNWYDVLVSTMSEYTSKYDTLYYTLRFNDNNEPMVENVVGGEARITLLSEFDPETRTYSNLSVNGNPQFREEYYLHLAQPTDTPAEVETVDSRATGFGINLYDYRVSSDDADSGESINEVSDLQFFEDADASTADDSAESNTLSDEPVALQGIVGSELGEDGFPTLTEFDDNSLDVLFDTEDTDSKTVYEDVNHLFQEVDGYYVYNSDTNYAFYDAAQGTGGDFAVYEATYNQARQTDTALIDSGVPIGFFPLDEYDELNNELMYASPEDDDTLNHGLGMSVDASFNMPESGTVDGDDIIFSYTGDDDAWLFVDDVLVLDAGGIHSKLNAEVNFTTGEVIVGNASALEAAERTIGRGNTLEEIFEAAGKEWVREGEHTIKFYTLERDGGQSDLEIKTNLYKVTNAKVTDVTVTKRWVDADGEECDPRADSVTVQLYQTIDGVTTPVEGRTLTLSADNDWSGIFASMPAVQENEDGTESRIVYSVKEEASDGSFATYEQGGVTQTSKVYWVRYDYDANGGVVPGIYAIQGFRIEDSDDTQPVLLTAVGEDKEVTYTDTFFVEGPVTDGATGETYDQYIRPVGENQIWTLSTVAPETYVTRVAKEGDRRDENGFLELHYQPMSAGSSGRYFNMRPGTFYLDDSDPSDLKLYYKNDEGELRQMIDVTVEYEERYDDYWVHNELYNYPQPIYQQEVDDNGYEIWFRRNYSTGYEAFFVDSDGKVYTKDASGNYSLIDGATTGSMGLQPANTCAKEDGYIILYLMNTPTSRNKYYTTENWDGVYRKNADGTFTKLTGSQYGDGTYVPYAFQPSVSYLMEDGYAVMEDEEGNRYYMDNSTPTYLRKNENGEYEPVFFGSVYLYTTQDYDDIESLEYPWQIANQGLNLTLAGPGQQWMDYTFITSTRNEQGSSNEIMGATGQFADWNFRNTFRLDTFTTNNKNPLSYYMPDGQEGGDPIPYNDAGLRIYSFQELWMFTGFVTGYEKNLMVDSSTYQTKESYDKSQAGDFWLYKPIYVEEPLDLSSTDWTVVNIPAGNLSVTKEVTGKDASEDDEFTFTIILSGDEDLVNQVNGTFGDIEFVGGMATVTLKGGETKTATNLPAGLEYTVEETVLPDYELTSKSGDTGTIPEQDTAEATFTNNKELPAETCGISVVKIWDDGEDADGIRPESITVHLYADGVDTGMTLELSAANSWDDTFSELPMYNEETGEKIVYTVVEDTPEGYTAQIEPAGSYSFAITNVHEPKPAPKPVPKTGDPFSIAVIATVGIAGAAALATGIAARRKEH